MDPSQHIVNVGPNGTFRQSGRFATTPADIDAMFDRVEAEGVETLVVHFHGGLIKEATGLAIAERMIPFYQAAGAYPMVFVWETGMLETIRGNLGTLNDTTLFNKIVNYAIRHVAKNVGVSVGGRGPGVEIPLDEIERARAEDADFEEINAGARAGALPLDEAELEAHRPEIEVEIEADIEDDDELRAALAEEADGTPLLEVPQEDDPGARGIFELAWVAKAIASIVFRTIRRFLSRRDHGVIATVVEETLREVYVADAGAWMWGGMKTIAEAMWKPNAEPIGDDDHVGTHFLDRLADLHGRRPNLAVDLVGHSAGSIAIAHLLSAARGTHPDLRFRHVVLLAPAATCEVFNTQIGGADDVYEDFRMFTMTDETERQDRLLPGVYPHSLLYLVSGVLEDEADMPLCGLDRHTGRLAPYDVAPGADTHTFLRGDVVDRLVLSPTRQRAAAGLRTSARRHADFDNDELTLASLAAIVKS